jgi:HD-like signal output (HDOD) protein
MQYKLRVPVRVSQSGIVELSDAELNRQRAVEDAVREAVTSPAYVPPTLPRAAMEVIALSRHPEVRFEDLERAMNSDPLLAARVLRRAQSPFFAGNATLQSLRDALIRLGIAGIRNLVLEESLQQRLFRAEAYQQIVEESAAHASRVAVAARAVARYTSLSADYLYLVGLLHDLGVGVALAAIVDKLPRELHPAPNVAAEYVVGIHEELGAMLARIWELPPEVSILIENHHQPVIGGFAHPIACALVIAEDIVETGAVAGWDRPQRLAAFAQKSLGLSDAQRALAQRDISQGVAGR